jgi:mRNA-degrading endonuclease RelE of RelBE toxin-antitoxin system
VARRDPIFSPDAARQLKKLRTYDQRVVLDGVQGHLVEADPDETTRNKFRLRRSSEFADYELRIGDVRVFYRIEASGEIVITVIGIKKGNTLVVEGEEFEI